MISSHDNARRWYAVAVEIGREPDTRMRLAEQDYETWLPLLAERVRRPERRDRRDRGERWRVVEHPLFPGYLFLGADDQTAWHPVTDTRGVIGVVSIQGQPLPARVGQVERIQALALSGDGTLWLDGEGELRAGPLASAAGRRITSYRVGEALTITDGPFTSFPARYREPTREGAHRVWAMLFGRATPVELEEGAFRRA